MALIVTASLFMVPIWSCPHPVDGLWLENQAV
jgi:hypothetical protein